MNRNALYFRISLIWLAALTVSILVLLLLR
jgi:hypothetical protein